MSLATGLATYEPATQALAMDALVRSAYAIEESSKHLECAQTQLPGLGLTWTEPTLQAVWDGFQTGIGTQCDTFEALVAAISAGTWQPE